MNATLYFLAGAGTGILLSLVVSLLIFLTITREIWEE